MDATELELRRRISELEEKIEQLQDFFLQQTINEDITPLEERLRRNLADLGLIDHAAEDE